MHLKSAAIIVTMGVTLAAQAVEPPDGCFVVQISVGSGSEQAKSLRLTDVRALTPWGNGDAKQIVPARSGEQFSYKTAYWRREGGELILTFTNNGLSGTELRVRPTDVGFKGLIQNFMDFEPGIENVRPVALTRFDCGIHG